jgi:exodeoxyribonuclease-5
MNWSPQQDQALEAVRKWLEADIRPPIFRLFGYAGTGKTTLAIEIAEMVRGHCMFGSFTGKAALVMRRKGCHGAKTLHSMIYKPRRKNRGNEEQDREIPMWELNPDSELKDADLLIIDECSMVGQELALDVLSFKVPVLVLGDPAQLPPVGGAGYFTEAEPDVMLTEIHRQAADNPIVRIATQIRLGETLVLGSHKGARAGQGVAIVARSALKLSTELAADQILCGKNDSRVTINRRIREQLRAEGKLLAGDHLPVIGDNRENDLKLPERMHRGHYDEFDYAYAITCHKSQGSQWDKVVVMDESQVFGGRGDSEDIPRRWLYTAATRAAQALIIAV